MKKMVVILMSVLLLSLLFTACAAAPAPADAPEATQAPAATESADAAASLSFTTLTGDTLDESVFSDHKLVMVNYWATWCGPCVGEIPDLIKISDDYANKGFQLVGVAADNSDVENAKQFIADQGIPYPVVKNEGFFLDEIQGYQYIPTTLFYDSTGKQVGQAVVGANSYEDWSKLIDALLKQVS
ncbi:MAG: TlpA disulfide reductase family protein [Christensenella sp.]|nr:TlpA disulfide reductase family protein [Christensenella sp.]